MLLTAGLLALLIGPLLYKAVEARSSYLSVFDGFILVSITGIAVLDVLPGTVENGGLLSLLFLTVGLFGPTVIEKLFHKASHQTHTTALVLGILGLVLHTLVDGVALLDVPADDTLGLQLAVVLHRFPAGLTIWWLLRPHFGTKVAVGTLVLMEAGTIAGFVGGGELLLLLSGQGMAWFQALVAGSVLHVVFHRPHGKSHAHTPPTKWMEGLGNVLGIGMLLVLAYTHSEALAGHDQGAVGEAFLGLALESAPALLLAYLVGGMFGSFMPRSSLLWLKKGNALNQSLKGMAVGLPLPICTCGVLPLYRSFIKKGVPPFAALAFLIATPELGIDAVFISIPLLGTDMAIVRVAAAVFIALAVALSVGVIMKRYSPDNSVEEGPYVSTRGIAFSQKLKQGIREGLGSLVDDTAPWILVGLVVAAWIEPRLSYGWFEALPQGLDVLLFAVLGLPIYVCASAVTPLVAVLLINGLSPGAAIAFLLTGPATNVSTFGILSGLHGRCSAIVFGVATAFFAVAAGYLVNIFFSDLHILSAADVVGESTGLLQVISLVLLTAVYLFSLLRRGARAYIHELVSMFSFKG